ncbi:response regulator transcription factor [Fulvivirga sediminis]|uniref:Response regulator transcription factor n=1 Tax=Fulvivirga sediminis TaxID=2803949 RepID=A0A937F7U3_9BACT|nr:response regulator transcription factor [Fulvivirga sediminis]MBL3657921.1 response regulator transcription factor [Fulvivirga sediminis]
MEKKFNIIIADDHVMFLDGLHAILSELPEIDTIHLATDGVQVMRLLHQFKDVEMVISDINMPKMDGLTLLSEVKKFNSNIKFFVLSMLEDMRTINKVVQKEADGYLLKFADKEELKAAVKEVLSGEQHYSSTVKERYMKGVFEKKKNPTVELSARETEILKLLAEELTSKEIAEKLFISVNTVETHRKNILLKTGSKTTTGAVKYAIENDILD